MPDVIVFHSPHPLEARLAALLYLRRLPMKRPGLRQITALLIRLDRSAGLAELLRPQPGLRHEGLDPEGRHLLSLGTGSAAGVVERVFSGMALLTGVPAGSYLLVGAPPIPRLLRWWGLMPGSWGAPLAARVTAFLLWPHAACLAERAAALAAAGATGPNRSPVGTVPAPEGEVRLGAGERP